MLLINVLTPEEARLIGSTEGGDSVWLSLWGSAGCRQRVEMSPVYLTMPDGSIQKVLNRAAQVVADPFKEDEWHPIGHCFEGQLGATWDKSAHLGYVRLIEEACSAEFPWKFMYEGGSIAYYRGASDPTMRKKVWTRTSRTIIAVRMPQVLLLNKVSVNTLRVDFAIEFGIVTHSGVGTDPSDQGETLYGFGGFSMFQR